MLREHEALPYRDIVTALQTLCSERATGFMLIHADSNHSARIGLADGIIQSINFGKFHGVDAIRAVKGIQWGKFSFFPVAYRSAARCSLPSTEMILTELAEPTWFRTDGSDGFLSGMEGSTEGPERRAAHGPVSAESASDIFAAAQLSVGQGRDADPFVPRPQADRIPRGVAAAKGLAQRLFGRGRPAAKVAAPDQAGDIFSRTPFRPTAEDLASSRLEESDNALAAEMFGITVRRDPVGPGEDATAMDISGAAAEHPHQGPLAEADQEAIARDIFGITTPQTQASIREVEDETILADLFAVGGHGDDEVPDATAVLDLFAEAGRPDERETSDDERIALELFDRPERALLSEVPTPDDLDLEREIFTATVDSEDQAQDAPPLEPVSEDDDIARQLFSAASYDAIEMEFSSEDNLDLASVTVAQQIFGSALVELVIERLSQALGPVAPMVVVKVEAELRALVDPGQLDSVLLTLSEEIDDPERAQAFRAEVRDAVFSS